MEKESTYPVILMLGAFLTGLGAYLFIQLIARYTSLSLDTSLAIALSSLFGLGMVLKTYIQGNPKIQGASQAGLQTFIFGQAAFLKQDDVRVILILSFLVLGFFVLFYKELKLLIFDADYARLADCGGDSHRIDVDCSNCCCPSVDEALPPHASLSCHVWGALLFLRNLDECTLAGIFNGAFRYCLDVSPCAAVPFVREATVFFYGKEGEKGGDVLWLRFFLFYS